MYISLFTMDTALPTVNIDEWEELDVLELSQMGQFEVLNNDRFLEDDIANSILPMTTVIDEKNFWQRHTQCRFKVLVVPKAVLLLTILKMCTLIRHMSSQLPQFKIKRGILTYINLINLVTQMQKH